VSSKTKVDIVKRKEKSNKKKKKGGKNKSGEKERDPNSSHSSGITALAISSDGKFLASGDLDGKIVIWDPATLKRIHIFTGKIDHL
jgi:ribosomal RNA-processing protein 9